MTSGIFHLFKGRFCGFYFLDQMFLVYLKFYDVCICVCVCGALFVQFLRKPDRVAAAVGVPQNWIIPKNLKKILKISETY